MVFLGMEQEQHTKQDWYIAQLIAEVRSFRSGFSSTPKNYEAKDFLVKFERQATESGNRTKSSVAGTKEKLPDLEDGDELSEGWQRVNSHAKSVWAARFGASSPEELKGGSPNAGT
jgi:hypothetical protein